MNEYNINQTTLKILGLYRTDYRRPCYVREAARDIDVDVKATQLQLRKLEKMNVLSSADRGRIKEYRLNLENHTGLYLMVMAETFFTITYLNRNFLVKKLVSEVGSHIDGTILLFGSLARARATGESDVDLMVLVKEKPDAQTLGPLRSIIGRRISLKHMDPPRFLEGLRQKDPLVMEIAANHVVLKGADEFCNLMWQHYA